MSKIFLVLTIMAAALLLSAPAHAATYTVDTATDDAPVASDCTDADSGTPCSLRDAIEAANANSGDDTIEIDASVTDPITTLLTTTGEDSNASGDYDIDDSGSTLTITGQGIGSTIIDGDSIDRVFHVHSGNSLDISNLTIQNGDANAAGTNDTGGAIHFQGAEITIDSVYFYANEAHYGGALYTEMSDGATITDSIFEDNDVYKIENSVTHGGAIKFTASGGIPVATVSGSQFINNGSAIYGGAFYNDVELHVYDSLFENNLASTGAVYSSYKNEYDIYFTNVFITTTEGKVIAHRTNSSSTGSYGTITIAHSTIHSSDNDRSALYAQGSEGQDANIVIQNSIITGFSESCTNGGGLADISSGGYNIIDTADCGFGETGDQESTDPLLSTDGFTDNGGTFDTYALQLSSPAVDAIPSASCLDAEGNTLAEDARGMTRPENTDCDAGAYELDQTGATVTLDSGNVTLECGVDTWSAPTVMSVVDNFDTTVTTASLESNNTDESTVGSYNAVYASTEDYDGNVGRASQAVNVVDTTAPTITLTGDEEVSVEQGGTYTESGATVNDACEGGLSVTVGGDTVDTDTPGEYTVTYNVTDAEGNTATEVTRTVTVVPDTTAPVITLVGESSVTVEFGATYTDDGATATDAVDGDLTSSIVTVNPVDTDTAGTYTVTYNVTDEAGNVAAEVTRTVIVSEEVLEDQDPEEGNGDGSEDTEATLGAVTQVTRLANNMVTITYAEGETKTFNVFGGTAKAKVKLHSNGDVLIAISKKYIRTFDAYTGEKIDQKKLFKNKQKYTKFKKYNVYNASDDNTANSVIVLARTKKNQHKKVKMRHIVVKNDGTMSKKNVVNVTLNKKIKKFKNVSLKRNKKNGKNFRVTLTKKGKKLKNFKYKVTKKKKQLKKV